MSLLSIHEPEHALFLVHIIPQNQKKSRGFIVKTSKGLGPLEVFFSYLFAFHRFSGQLPVFRTHKIRKGKMLIFHVQIFRFFQ